MLNIKLDRQHTMFLDMYNWVKVGDFIIIKENKNNYYCAKLVKEAWMMKEDAQITIVTEEEN
jgi:hypothetical protein